MENEIYLPNSDGHIARFPSKLWNILESCKSGAIKWNNDGTIIKINRELFEAEYLRSSETRPFQTRSFNSFIRQLNFYGFQKVNHRIAFCSEPTDLNIFQYRHPYFQRALVDFSKVQRRNKSKRPQNFEEAFARIINPTTPKDQVSLLPVKQFNSIEDIRDIYSSQVNYGDVQTDGVPVQVFFVDNNVVLQPTEHFPNPESVKFQAGYQVENDGNSQSFLQLLLDPVIDGMNVTKCESVDQNHTTGIENPIEFRENFQTVEITLSPAGHELVDQASLPVTIE